MFLVNTFLAICHSLWHETKPGFRICLKYEPRALSGLRDIA
jgi:hypothetical protein